MKLKKHLAQGNIIYFHAGEQQVSVADNFHYRWLSLNGIVQSVMLNRKPWQLTLPHQLAMVLPLQFFTPKNILELGLGGGALNRYIKFLIPKSQFTSVELSREIVACYTQLFNPDNHTLNIINSSADRWLEAQCALDFDWIVMDIFLSIEDSVISFHMIDNLLYKNQNQSLITLNLPNENEQKIEVLLKKLKLFPNIHVVYFNVPHYKNIVLHIIPITLMSEFNNKKTASIAPYKVKRWQYFWQQGIHL
ncbi:hypothetical protein [Thalassotalea profundi]|uniref:SAM-dependent methyltransferase n=1 Tax=Thalassotalea profundi TaxID=2036687 RepID=A0ABQ3IVK6_9GAMM|nr:hypothetical protein [Thalassotalea profundi]GHE94106.1 SAM-dependent methyltransferase [Thalassotalea profundi]